MKLYLAAYRKGVRLNNGPGNNLYPLDGLTAITVSKLKEFLQASCCTSNKNKKKKDCMYCTKGYDMWTNIPRGFQFLKGEKNNWWYEKGRSDREYASVYVDGGLKGNKIDAMDEFELKEGSVLYLRPSIEHRDEEYKWMFNMEFHVVTDEAVGVPTASKIAAIRSDFPSSPSVSVLSLDIKHKTPTKAEAKAKSGTSPSSVYSCTPDGGHPFVEWPSVERVVIDNPYSEITDDHLLQAFGLTDEEKDAAYTQQVKEEKAALAVALYGTGFSPVKNLKWKPDDDDDGDLMRF